MPTAPAREEVTSEGERSLSDLCLECGLCCDGSLFDMVALTPEEYAATSARGLAVQRKGGRHGLTLRCTALEGRCCTNYLERPSGCRGFVCHLGKQLEAKAVTFPRALEVVRDAQARVLALGAQLQPPRTTRVMPAIRVGLADPLAPFSDALRAEALATQRRLTEVFHGWS